MVTYEIDVRAKTLGRFWLPADARLRLMPTHDTSAAIVNDGYVWESRGDAVFDALASASADKRVLLIIHGYNSNDKNVRPSYATLYDNITKTALAEHYDVLGFVYWPGGWGPGYAVARWRTGGVGRKLRDVVLAMPKAACIDIQTHSLGAKCALELLKNGDLCVRNLVMAAAAVQDDDCTIGGKYAAAINTLRGRALAPYSAGDNVLGEAFRLMEMDRALGWGGPQHGLECPPKLICVDASEWGNGHSVFRTVDGYYKMWLDFLEGKI